MKRIFILFSFLFVSCAFSQDDIPVKRNIDMKNNKIKNVEVIGKGDFTEGALSIPIGSGVTGNSYDDEDGEIFIVFDYAGRKLTLVDRLSHKVYTFIDEAELNSNDFIPIALEYPQANEKRLLFTANYDFTIDSIRYTNRSDDIDFGQTAVRIYHGSNYVQGIQLMMHTPYIEEEFYNIMEGIVYKDGFNDNTIAKGEQVWCYMMDVIGNPEAFHIDLYYTRN